MVKVKKLKLKIKTTTTHYLTYNMAFVRIGVWNSNDNTKYYCNNSDLKYMDNIR